ncbi:putative bifunctional DNA N-glycosylase with associated apurinic apyrimidinic (AP) lyase function [Trypoxylus dichotomus]
METTSETSIKSKNCSQDALNASKDKGNGIETLTKSKRRPHLKIKNEDLAKMKTDSTEKSNEIKLLVDDSIKDGYLKSEQNWAEVLKNLREMRKDSDAPVDSMGCHRCVDKNASAKDMRYQALLALMLSSQTKDNTTHAAMLKLHKYGCTIEDILKISDEKLGQLIYPVSFWKRKVQYIKKTTEILKSKFNNDIPYNVEDLCKLPGVGPKMAHLCMQIAWNKVTGIGVDTHVHRISNRLGWVKTKTPEETRIALENLLPQELWIEINQLLVGFGQQICQPVKPKCIECLNNQICPVGIKNSKI